MSIIETLFSSNIFGALILLGGMAPLFLMVGYGCMIADDMLAEMAEIEREDRS